ncbi:MAG TPA: hypothetical protein VFL42_11160 [Terriglobales bacterium]|nr:hypothetical protein [Terriglobales bacterium]
MLLFAFLVSVITPAYATDGMFQGRVINPPFNQPLKPGWIFVQGRNHMARRVEVSHAVIVFGQQVPASQRRACGMECLAAGQEVRVTAVQDSSGEWRAKKVEILELNTNWT